MRKNFEQIGIQNNHNNKKADLMYKKSFKMLSDVYYYTHGHKGFQKTMPRPFFELIAFNYRMKIFLNTDIMQKFDISV